MKKKSKRKPWISLKNAFVYVVYEEIEPHLRIVYKELTLIIKILDKFAYSSVIALWAMYGFRRLRQFIWYAMIGWWTKEE